jgi:ribonuclease P/MRP protein subunit POP3
LCSLLEPLGQHRRDHVKSSQGKRSRRRYRQRSKQIGGSGEPDGGASLKEGAKVEATEKPDATKTIGSVPPLPELARFVNTGLASITRELAKGATPGAPVPTSNLDPESTSLPPSTTTTTPSRSSTPYTVIFIIRSGHPSTFYSHFPQMVAVASQQGAVSTPASPPIRLVGFSRACEDRLSASLGIPRVSSIALRAGAPQSQGLLAFLEETVPAVDVRWLDEAQAGQYRETQIHMAEVRVGPKRKKKV